MVLEKVTPHTHNDQDSPKLYLGDSVVSAPQEAVTPVANTADSTYSANEQAMLNEIKASLNDLIEKMQTLGLLR